MFGVRKLPKFQISLSEINKERAETIMKRFKARHNLTTKVETFLLMLDKLEKILSIPEVEIITSEERDENEYILSICDRGLMQIIGGIPTCGQKIFPRGITTMKPFIYPKDTPNEGIKMEVVDIEKTCGLCKQSFTEDSRIQELMDRMSLMYDPNQPIELYFCFHPSLSNFMFTAFKDAIILCAKINRNVKLEKQCILRNCEHLETMSITAPPPTKKEE